MTAEKTHCNVLFVVLPNKETLTTRKLPQRVTVDFLKAKLELATGVHGNAMQLVYGGVLLADDTNLCFGENLRNGGLMKVMVADQLLGLYLAICESDVQKVIDRCLNLDNEERLPDADPEGEFVLNADDRMFFSLLLACKRGSLDVIKAILNLDSEGLWRKQCTRFRRTLAHVAAGSDQTKTLEFLLEQDAPAQTADCFGKTPLDIAISHGAYACERLIKQTIMRQKSARTRPAVNARKKKSGSKVCWKDNKENSTAIWPRAASTIQRYGMTPLNSGFICGTPLGSSRRTSANVTSAQLRSSQQVDVPHEDRTRSRSADVDKDHDRGSSRKLGCNHRRCTIRPPFMAFRSVPQEELRPVTVEYVPLPVSSPATGHQRKAMLSSAAMEQQHRQKQQQEEQQQLLQPDYPKAPCSSLNNSIENLAADSCLSERELILQKRSEMMKRYTKVNGITSRAQSAKYYRTKYHIEAECDASIPKPRPSTAGPRYREWKTWLLDQMEMEARKAKNTYAEVQRRKLNELAYRKWLARHRKNQQNGRSSTDDESSEDEDEKREAREEAYQMWLESKRDMFEEMDKKRRQILNGEGTDAGRCIQRDRRLAVFEIGACIDEPAEPSKPDRYIRAYQTWIRNKKNYENWKRRNGLPVDEARLSREQFIRTRDTLLLDGMTYNEWLGLKAREQTNNKLHLHKF